jgi:hypothetical protein
MTLLLDRATRSAIAKQRADDRLERQRLERQRRYERHETHLAERHRRRHARRHAIREFANRLPARLILVPVVLAAAAAWRGQEDWASTGLHWSLLWAAGLATALETLGFALGAMARSARNDGDSAHVERVLMWAVVASAAYLNWHHSHEPVLGLMSIAGVAGWEVYERRVHRHAMRAARPALRPRFGVARWVRFPGWTFQAWSISVRDRLSVDAAEQALQRAATERAAKTVQRHGRRHWAPRVHEHIDREREAAMARATKIAENGEAMLAAATVLLGPDTLRAAATESATPATATQPATAPWTGLSRVRRALRRPPADAGTELAPAADPADPVDDAPASPAQKHAEGATVTDINAPRRTSGRPPTPEQLRLRAAFDQVLAAGQLDEMDGSKLGRQAGVSESLGRKWFRIWTDELKAGQVAQ